MIDQDWNKQTGKDVIIIIVITILFLLVPPAILICLMGFNIISICLSILYIVGVLMIRL